MYYTLERTQKVMCPLDDVFAFFGKPENLARMTPRSLGFEILTPSPIVMKSGALIDYTIKVMGVRQHWTTLITDYSPPYGFVDVQLKGPFTFWHHTHSFEAVPGGTRMTDRVRYVLPFGPLGGLAHALFVKRQLARIFAHRERTISELFGNIVTPAGS